MAEDIKSPSEDMGVKIMRLGLGSYFMAIAAGQIEGVNPAAALELFMPSQKAAVLGCVVLSTISVMMMAGIRPRTVALALVGFVLTSSLVENLLITNEPDVSAYWRDVTLLFAVILTYWVDHLPKSAQELIKKVPIPRRLYTPTKPRTARPDRPKVRTLKVDQLCAGEDGPRGLVVVQEEMQAIAVCNIDDSSQEKLTDLVEDFKDIRIDELGIGDPEPAPFRFRPLPLNSPHDPPRENIFVHI